MKKIQLCLIVLIVGCGSLFGQVCNTNPNITNFISFNDSIPCVVQGNAYNAVITFKSFDTISFAGNTIHIDSVTIDTIANLPCGIVWQSNKPSKTYRTSEFGCITFSGTTNDAVGQYTVNLALRLYIGGVAIPYNGSSLGLNNHMIVKATAGASCPLADSNATQLTASCITPQPIDSSGGGSGCTNFQVYLNGPNNVCIGDTAFLSASAVGGNGALSFQWSTGSIASNISLVPTVNNTYSVTVSDGTCTNVATKTVNVTNCTSCNPNANISVPSLPIFDDSVPCVIQGATYTAILTFLNIDILPLGGNSVHVDSVTIDTISNLPCGIIWNCNKANRTYSRLELGCITLSGSTNDSAGLYKMNVAISIYIAGARIPYNYNNLGLNSFIKVKASAGAICPAIDTINNPLLTASCITPMPSNNIVYDVWPGDADHNGVVDANDALQISIEYGSTGASRSNASMQWAGQSCLDWNGVTYGVNDKHADCDGNGIINVDDTLAVTQNYSLTHNKTQGAKAQASDPVISFVPVTDTITANQSFRIKIMLGDAATPVDSLYGIAFSMNLDPAIFDTTGAQLILSNSWMGNISNAFSFRKALPGQGKIDMVLARNDHHNANGHGQIGELVLKTQQHIVTNTTSLNLAPTVIKGITASGSTKTYNTLTTAVTVTGIEEPTLTNSITLYPIPNNGHFTLSIDQPTQQLKIELLNIQGQILYTEQLKDQSSFKKELNFSDLAKGVYLLKVSTENGVAVKRVVVE